MDKIKVLGTGSSGNCYSLEIDNEILLLDAGMNYKEILNFIDYRLDKVQGCLVTHLHNDHSKAVKDLVKNSVSVYALDSVFESKKVQTHRSKAIKPSIKPFKVGNYTILAFDLEHDVPNVGYLIRHKNGTKVLYITDTYYCKYRFTGVHHILIECNYSKDIIDESLKDKMFLRNRVVQSHFELNNMIDFLKASDLSQLKTLTLIHLSGGNSDSELFKETVNKKLGIPVNIACKGLEIYL